jgi:hypothetical protein
VVKGEARGAELVAAQEARHLQRRAAAAMVVLVGQVRPRRASHARPRDALAGGRIRNRKTQKAQKVWRARSHYFS